MDRRYYVLKVGVILVALVAAAGGITSGAGPARMIHETNFARYSAPATVEAAAWRTTTRLAHAVAWLIGTGASVQR